MAPNQAKKARDEFVTGAGSACLLHCDQCPNRNLSEELARCLTGEANASMRRRIIRHDAFMHPKIKAAQPHEIGHLDFVNCRAVRAILVGDDVIASSGGITASPGRADRLKHRDTILDYRGMLGRQGDFDSKLFR